ncbi:MAG: hypothetical protein M1118_05400 [Chloroflexi bacterium]|nr:hypothetical protein [Chloroflexota bacterium]
MRFPSLPLHVIADDDAAVLQPLKETYGAFLRSSCEEPALEIHASESTGALQVSVSRPLRSPQSILIPDLGISEILLRIYVDQCAQRHLLHAAVIAHSGKAVVLAAPSSTGKTTLALAACASGWSFCSDEVAALLPETGTVNPFPRAAFIRLPTLHHLAQIGLKESVEGMARVRLDETAGIAICQPFETIPPDAALPLAGFVFLRRSSCGVLLQTIPPSRVAIHLLQQTLNGATLGRRAFLQAARLAQVIPAYSLDVTDTRSALAALKQLIG